jgi:hypothetical protein
MTKRLFAVVALALLLVSAWVTQAAPVNQGTAPRITDFGSSATGVDRQQLATRTARIPVRWDTANRPAGSNLVFEQVLPDGRVMNVELPRDNPFVADRGQGVVQPFPPGDVVNEVLLRVRLVTIARGTVLDERSFALPIVSGSPAPQPTIRVWTSGTATVNRAALLDGSARVPVEFAVDNRPAGSNLVFEQVVDGRIVNVELPRTDPLVPSSGRGVVAPINPATSTPNITLRLSVIAIGAGTLLTQREITVPIAEIPAPVIRTFSTSATGVDRGGLVSRTARLPVDFAVENRPNGTNLVFEQVLPNNQVVNVELPRQNPIIPSAGRGSVSPVDPGTSATSVLLRLRLIEISSGRTLGQSEISVPITTTSTQVAIQTWSSTASAASRAELIANTARIPVSFAVINRPANSNLVFEQVLPNNQVVNVELPRTVPIVPSQGQGAVAPVDPGAGATSITLRLRVIDLGTTNTLVQRDISLNITEPPAPTITVFSATQAGVSRGGLRDGTIRLPVDFAVTNRPAGTNLVFEQVLPNNQIVNIELPRTEPIIPSQGRGTVAPRDPGNNATSITLRLSLIRIGAATVLTQREITVPIIDGTGAVINQFTSALTGADRLGLQNRTIRVPVTWQVLNRPADSNLVFEQILDDGTVVNVELPRQNPVIPSEGTGSVAPVLPGTGTSIRLRVRLIDRFSPAVYDSKEITLPIVESPSAARITLFNTTTNSIDITQLRNRSARASVSWRVQNRPPNSNLVFEQVPALGPAFNIELPRTVPIVPSEGVGLVAPIDPPTTSGPTITIRLRLIDLRTTNTLDIREISIPIAGVTPIPPTPQPTPTATPTTNPGSGQPTPTTEVLPTATTPAPSNVNISSFTVNPGNASSGDDITFAWTVTGDATSIDLYIAAEEGAGRLQLIASSLPASGTHSATIPAAYIGSAPYTLVVTDGAGREAERTVAVTIDCRIVDPLVFGACPLDQQRIQSAYQAFENGHMFWNGNTRQIYVLFGDGSWVVMADTWTAADPAPQPANPPGAGQVVPQSGFGKVWASLGADASPLGFATAAEQGYQATWETYQAWTGGAFASAPHILMPDGRVARLYNPWRIEARLAS